MTPENLNRVVDHAVRDLLIVGALVGVVAGIVLFGLACLLVWVVA